MANIALKIAMLVNQYGLNITTKDSSR